MVPYGKEMFKLLRITKQRYGWKENVQPIINTDMVWEKNDMRWENNINVERSAR